MAPGQNHCIYKHGIWGLYIIHDVQNTDCPIFRKWDPKTQPGEVQIDGKRGKRGKDNRGGHFRKSRFIEHNALKDSARSLKMDGNLPDDITKRQFRPFLIL